MSNTIKQQIDAHLKDAMRAREKELVAILRFIMAGIKQKEIDERITLDDSQLVALLDKMARQRREAMDQFQQAGRDELAAKEATELDIIQRYLPNPLSDEELIRLVDETITSVQASSIKDMGKVMGLLKPQIQGRADGGAVSKLVKEKLTS